MSDNSESAEIAAGFLRYIDNNNKRHLLREVLAILHAEVEPQLPEIMVESAVELPTAERQAILDTLSSKPHSGEIKFVVNPELIGGLRITHGDKVLDMSVQGRLKRIYA
jgi:F-type H+-transporting ATPase subunit delta